MEKLISDLCIVSIGISLVLIVVAIFYGIENILWRYSPKYRKFIRRIMKG